MHLEPTTFSYIFESDAEWEDGRKPDTSSDDERLKMRTYEMAGEKHQALIFSKIGARVNRDIMTNVNTELNYTLSVTDDRGEFYKDLLRSIPGHVKAHSDFGHWTKSTGKVYQEGEIVQDLTFAPDGTLLMIQGAGAGDGGDAVSRRTKKFEAPATRGSHCGGGGGESQRSGGGEGQTSSRGKGNTRGGRGGGGGRGGRGAKKRGAGGRGKVAGSGQGAGGGGRKNKDGGGGGSGSDSDDDFINTNKDVQPQEEEEDEEGEEGGEEQLGKRKRRELGRLSKDATAKRSRLEETVQGDPKLLAMFNYVSEVEKRMVKHHKAIYKVLWEIVDTQRAAEEVGRHTTSQIRKLSNFVPTLSMAKETGLGKVMPFQSLTDLVNGCKTFEHSIPDFIYSEVPFDSHHFSVTALKLVVGDNLRSVSRWTMPGTYDGSTGADVIRMGRTISKLPARLGSIMKTVLLRNPQKSNNWKTELALMRKSLENSVYRGRCDMACVLAEHVSGEEPLAARAACLTILLDLDTARKGKVVVGPLPPLDDKEEVKAWLKRHENDIRDSCFPPLSLPTRGEFDMRAAIAAKLPYQQTFEDLLKGARGLKEGKPTKIQLYQGSIF